MAEFDILSKDYIKLYFLNEIINTKNVNMNVYLEIDGIEKNFLDVRTEGKTTYRFNNFNVSEDASGNCLTFRPIVIGCLAYFKISSNQPLRIDIVKNGTNSVAQTFDILPGESKIEFDPQGTSKYVMIVEQISVIDATKNQTQISRPEENTSSSTFGNSFGSDFGSDFTFGTMPTNEPKGNKREEPPVQQENILNNNTPVASPFESEFSGFDVAPIPVVQAGENATNTYSNSVQTLISPQSMATPEQPAHSNFSTVSSDEVRGRQNELNDLQHSESRLNAEIADLNTKIAELNDKIQQLTDNKRHLVEHMDKLQAEYNKDYSNYEKDVEEIKSRYDIDEEILLMYADKEVGPIEELVERAKYDVSQVEEQVRIFIEAQARKTAEIENELKIGKKE